MLKVCLEYFLENSNGSLFANVPVQAVPDGRSSNRK